MHTDADPGHDPGFDDLTAARDELPVFSRPASSPIFGKRDVPIKTLLTDEVAEDFRRHAIAAGYTSLGDCLRDLIEVTVYGPEHLVSLRQKQLAALGLNRSETVPPSARG